MLSLMVTFFVLDAKGTPWITYDDDETLSLKIARKKNGKWNISMFAIESEVKGRAGNSSMLCAWSVSG